MKKILFSLFILLAVNSQAQFVYPTETVWDFLSGLQTNRINSSTSTRLGINVAPLQDFHVLADTVRFEGLDGTGGFLTIDANGVVNKGVAALTGLTPDWVLLGAADGTVAQTTHFYFDDVTDNLYLDANNPTLSILGGVTSTIAMSGTANQYNISSLANGDFRIESNGGGSPIAFSFASQRIGLNQVAPLQDFHLVADTIRFEGLDGTGTYLGIDVNGDVTRTTVTGFGDVYKVGTPVNNQVGVWTGDGTIEGEASLTYDATAGFDLANSFDAQWSTTGSGTLITGNLSNASATGKLIDLQHDETTKFQVTYTGSTVIGKTSIDAVHALKAGQLGVGATGDVFQMANASGNTTTFTVDGKIDLYATEVPANGEILIGDGTDMELATITAGSGITVSNGAGSITIAETNEAATTYTPTAASVTNVASIGTVYGHYYRDGDMVHVFVYTTAAATGSSALTEMSVTLPVASNFTAATEAFGSGTALSSANANGFSGRVFASAANDNVVFAWRPTSTATLEINFNFSYRIL